SCDNYLSNRVRHFARQSPRASLRVRFPLRTIRCGKSGYFKLRMVLKKLNEALTDHAGGAEDAYTKFLSHAQNLPQRTQRKHRQNQPQKCTKGTNGNAWLAVPAVSLLCF